jgi:hypothetical protein
MNHVLISVLSFVFISSAYLSWIILPLVNLNLISHSEAELHERAQVILDKQRSNPKPIPDKLKTIQVPNINIVSVDKLDLPDYYIFKMNYRFNKIIFNKFIGSDNLNQFQKSKIFILDRN